jgi:uncharacterized protein
VAFLYKGLAKKQMNKVLKYLLNTLVLMLLTVFANAQDDFKNQNAPEGTWYAKLVLPGTKVRLQLKIVKKTDGQYEGIQSRVGDNVATMPFTVNINGNKLAFTDNANARFEGIFTDSNIVGLLYQAGEPYELAYTSFPLYQTKETNKAIPPMPKTFATQNFKIENKADKNVISGTMFTQFRAGKIPTILLLSPGGPHPRFADRDQWKPYYDVADYFAKRGYNVVCFDDRGQGESTGDFYKTPLSGHIKDAQLVINYLKTLAQIDTTQLILIGHSQGGYFATELAKSNKCVRGVITLASSLQAEKVVLLDQLRNQAKENNLDAVNIANLEVFYNEIYDLALKQFTAKANGNLVEKFLDAQNSNLLQNMSVAEADNLRNTILQQVNNKYFMSSLAARPTNSLAAITKPILVIYAEKDEYLNNKANVALAQKALAKNKLKTIGTIRQVNHYFQECVQCTEAERELLEEPIANKVLDEIATWLRSIVQF